MTDLKLCACVEPDLRVYDNTCRRCGYIVGPMAVNLVLLDDDHPSVYVTEAEVDEYYHKEPLTVEDMPTHSHMPDSDGEPAKKEPFFGKKSKKTEKAAKKAAKGRK